MQLIVGLLFLLIRILGKEANRIGSGHRIKLRNRSKLQSRIRKHRLKVRMKEDGGKDMTIPAQYTELETKYNVEVVDSEINQAEFIQIFSKRKMTRGEIKYVFDTMDYGKNDKISQEEFEDFHELFIAPYEAATPDENYQLNQDSLGTVLETGNLTNLGLTKDNATQVLEILDKKGINETNFADYIFLRRVNLAWAKCGGGTSLSKYNLPCALKIVVPGWIASDTESEMLINMDQVLKNGKFQYKTSFMDMWGFMNTAHLYYYFYAFQIPYLDGQISKTDMKRAVDSQVVQTNLNQYLINIIFADNQQILLQHFCLGMWIFRRFQRHALTNALYLTEQEFLDLLNEFQMNKYILKLFDTFYVPTLEELEASYRPRKKLTESDYLVTFLELGSKVKRVKNWKANSYSQKYLQNYNALRFKEDAAAEEPNIENRKVIYNIFEFKDKQQLTFEYFLKFWKITWMFFNYDVNLDGSVSFIELRNGIQGYRPPITLSNEEESDLQYALDLIGTPTTNQLDLKQFYGVFMYRNVFTYYRENNFVAYVNDANLKKAMYMMGMKLTKQTEEKVREGKDELTGAMTYNFWYAYRLTLENEIQTQKILKMKKLQEEVEAKISGGK